MNKIFVIIIEPEMWDSLRHAEMIKSLKTDKDAVNWWHHLTNTYILIGNSNVSAQSIQTFVKTIFITNHFLVIEIPKIKDYKGWLPKEAWTWIQNNAT